MASRVGLIGFVLVAAAMLHQCSAATTYIVGDSAGWKVPTPADLYTNWASGKTFAVGDVLSFVFNANNHDVANVTKAGFDGCSNTGTIYNTSPANITLGSAGMHYFICTFPGHCANRQKLSINVGSTPSTGSGPTPAPTAGSTTPPSPSSASSLATGFGGLVAVLTAFFL